MLSVDEKVAFSKPSIDVLFESAALVYGENLTDFVLTSANNDGTQGARMVKKNGGRVIVQDPDRVQSVLKPKSVIDANLADEIFSLEEIVVYLESL